MLVPRRPARPGGSAATSPDSPHGDVERPSRLARGGVRPLAGRPAAPRAAAGVRHARRRAPDRDPARRGGGDRPARAPTARAHPRRRDGVGGRPGREPGRAHERDTAERRRRRPEPQLPLRELEPGAVVHVPAGDRPRAAEAAEPDEPLLARPGARLRAGDAGADGARPGAPAAARARPARADRADPRPRGRAARAASSGSPSPPASGSSPSSRSARPVPSTSGCSSRGSRRSSTRSSTPACRSSAFATCRGSRRSCAVRAENLDSMAIRGAPSTPTRRRHSVAHAVRSTRCLLRS